MDGATEELGKVIHSPKVFFSSKFQEIKMEFQEATTQKGGEERRWQPSYKVHEIKKNFPQTIEESTVSGEKKMN